MSSSDMGDPTIKGDQKEHLAGLWKAAMIVTPQNTTPQFLIAGVNVRFHLGHAMKAVLETAKATVSIEKVLHNPFEAWELVACASEIGASLMSIFQALIQRMTPIEYVTAAVLAEHIPSFVKKDELHKKIVTFLNDPNSDQYSWHLGMRSGRLDDAKKALEDDDWFEDALDHLRELELVKDEISGELIFEPVDFEVGIQQVVIGG